MGAFKQLICFNVTNRRTDRALKQLSLLIINIRQTGRALQQLSQVWFYMLGRGVKQHILIINIIGRGVVRLKQLLSSVYM